MGQRSSGNRSLWGLNQIWSCPGPGPGRRADGQQEGWASAHLSRRYPGAEITGHFWPGH